MHKIFLIACIFLVSCDHYLQPSKVQSERITQAYTDAMGIYNNTDHAYIASEEAYQVVSDELESVLKNDQVRTNAKQLVAIDLILIKGFNIRRGYHKGKGTLNGDEWRTEKKYMESYFNPRIRAEKSIK